MQMSHYKNPWLNLWITPRETIRYLLDTNPFKTILWLAFASGLLSAFTFIVYTWIKHPEKELCRNFLFIIPFLAIGGCFGLIQLYIGSWLIRLTGSWIGGKGNFIAIKCAIGWSYYPFIAATLLNLLLFAFSNLYIIGIGNFIYTALLIWAAVIYLKVIGEAHLFSAWRALAAVLIAFALIFACIVMVGVIISLFFQVR